MRTINRNDQIYCDLVVRRHPRVFSVCTNFTTEMVLFHLLPEDRWITFTSCKSNEVLTYATGRSFFLFTRNSKI